MPSPDKHHPDSFMGICTVYRFDGERPEAKVQANARLIAAAPELLATLIWILENDDTGPRRFCTNRDGPAQAIDNAVGKFGERARAAIAKATGQ